VLIKLTKLGLIRRYQPRTRYENEPITGVTQPSAANEKTAFQSRSLVYRKRQWEVQIRLLGYRQGETPQPLVQNEDVLHRAGFP